MQDCQDNCRSDVFGLKALVLKQEMSALTLQMQKVKADGSFQNFIYNCSIDEVTPWNPEDIEPKAKISIAALTDGEKRFMVKNIWGNQKGSSDNCRKKEMLADDDLLAVHEYLQWQYKQPLIALADASAVKIACVEGASTDSGVDCILQLQDLMKTKHIVVVPVHAALHWTALVLHMKELGQVEVKEVEYFDWASELSKANAAYAKKILRLMTASFGANAGKEPVQFPAKTNKFVQRAGSNDCGFAVWHALEVNMKYLRLEGRCRLCPSPDEWRQKLMTFEMSLLKEQQKWAAEDASKKKASWKPKFEITLPGSVEIKDKMEAKAMLHLKYSEGNVKTLSKEFFVCGSCRWNSNGDGCYNCNPAKAAAHAEAKRIQAEHLKNSVNEWFAALAAAGVVLEPLPADKKLEKETGKKLEGGNYKGQCN